MTFRYAIIFLITLLLLQASTLQSQSFIPGEKYYGRNNYIEYIAGNSPFIISAPHGGSLEPMEIPDRTVGATTKDANTEELVRDIYNAYVAATGTHPHVIICRLHRRKLDANREIIEAAQGNQFAEQAWNEFHAYIDSAKAEVTRTFGKGFYIDLHGHGHTIQRLELGYLLSSSQLDLSDNTLNSTTGYRNISSIRHMATNAGVPFSEILRGESSFGTFMEYRGYPSVPSLLQPSPASAPYFNGGYNTDRHGSGNGGTISGLQIECNMDGVRDTDANRKAFARAVAATVFNYSNLHLFKTVSAAKPNIVLNEVLFDIPADDSGTPELEGDANGDGVRSARGDEFIELINLGSTDADISGFRILERQWSPIFTFPESTILKPQEMAVVFGGVGPGGFGPAIPISPKIFAAKPGLADSGFYYSGSKTNLLSASDNVILIDPKSNFVADELTWGSSSPKTKYGKKLIAPNTVNGDSIAGAIQQSVTRHPTGTGLWTTHKSFSAMPYSPGAVGISRVPDRIMTVINGFMLSQNFPNPFNPVTSIRYTIPDGAHSPSIGNEVHVTIAVYDQLGKKIAVLVNETKPSGTYTTAFDASSVASGMFYYRMHVNGLILSRKMIVVK
jgi:hypothetical protein